MDLDEALGNMSDDDKWELIAICKEGIRAGWERVEFVARSSPLSISRIINPPDTSTLPEVDRGAHILSEEPGALLRRLREPAQRHDNAKAAR